MSYLICEECGKQHPLPEGEKSFNFEQCSCGGKLKYSTTKRDYSPKKDNHQKTSSPNKEFQSYQSKTTIKKNPHSKSDYSPSQKGYTPLSSDYADKKTKTGGLKWKGVLVGLLFLFVSLIISVAIVFGENVPTDPSSIPVQLLSYLSILTIILTILAGSVSAYLSGSKKYLEGAINGGMVGIILGLILGLVGGLMVFLSGTLVFGLLSMAGGIIGIFPRKLSKK